VKRLFLEARVRMALALCSGATTNFSFREADPIFNLDRVAINYPKKYIIKPLKSNHLK
jgi:hypothetical protein